MRLTCARRPTDDDERRQIAATQTAPMFASPKVNTPWLQDPGVDVSVRRSFLRISMGYDAALRLHRMTQQGTE